MEQLKLEQWELKGLEVICTRHPCLGLVPSTLGGTLEALKDLVALAVYQEEH